MATEFYDGTMDRDAIKVEDCVLARLNGMQYIAYYWGSKGDQKCFIRHGWYIYRQRSVTWCLLSDQYCSFALDKGIVWYVWKACYVWPADIWYLGHMDVIIAELNVRKHLQAAQKKKP